MPVDPLLRTAIRALSARDKRVVTAFNDYPVATYVTDSAGVVRHFNRACVSFAGRAPRVGTDKWCVSWELYTQDGRRLPHDQCPMAISIRERRPISGRRAVALRPDRTTVEFEPSPIPLYDDEGSFIGAVNVLRAVDQREDVNSLWAEAARCRRVARSMHSDSLVGALQGRAQECERKAMSFELGRSSASHPLMVTRNALLQNIELEAIGSFERLSLRAGDVLSNAGDLIEDMYFLESGMACLVARQGLREADVAMVGAEGLVGYECLLGSDRSFCTTVMRFCGSAIRIPASRVIALNTNDPLFSTRTMSFVSALSQSLIENCAATALLSVEARVARWLISASKHVGSEIAVTHDTIGAALGVRRAGVTIGLQVLEGERAIKSKRGRVFILDREKLAQFGTTRPR
jgi:CRP-like cAMP-binding protein